LLVLWVLGANGGIFEPNPNAFLRPSTGVSV
jgi:hypothetical protein